MFLYLEVFMSNPISHFMHIINPNYASKSPQPTTSAQPSPVIKQMQSYRGSGSDNLLNPKDLEEAEKNAQTAFTKAINLGATLTSCVKLLDPFATQPKERPEQTKASAVLTAIQSLKKNSSRDNITTQLQSLQKYNTPEYGKDIYHKLTKRFPLLSTSRNIIDKSSNDFK